MFTKFVKTAYFFLLCCVFLLNSPVSAIAATHAGTARANLTPPIGTPSAGYANRMNEGMQGVNDPLLAIALVIDNGEKMVAFCSVDHLGFTYEMVQLIIEQVHSHQGLEKSDIYVGSSHTHSGGGAYLDLPIIGPLLAGPYDSEITQFYINATVDAIVNAYHNLMPAKIGFGYGETEAISAYRGTWPEALSPLSDVALIKVTKEDGSPLAALFNYPLHPTILDSNNMLFSADFVGFARNHIKMLIGSDVEAIYFNGAQGDIVPNLTEGGDRYAYCDATGRALALTVAGIWNETVVTDSLGIATQREAYAFVPQPTPFGLKLPIACYHSEINLIVFNEEHAFVTIPGELSCVYDRSFKDKGKALQIPHVSVLGLVNDAHGYIILPESWRHRTSESQLSFGGELYGNEVESKVHVLLQERQ